MALADTHEEPAIEPLPGLVVTSAICGDLFFNEDNGAARTTPRGAALLVDLYERSALPTQGGRGEPDSKLTLYAASEDKLISMINDYQSKQRAEAARRQIFVADPSRLPEGEFTYSILDEIFWAKIGPFRGTRNLVIGNIDVTKCVSGPYTSNSGKSQDSAVEISWTGSDGEKRTVTNGGSRYKKNRRNDSERNWGLPE